MTSTRQCINNAFEQGVIGLQEKQRLEARFERLMKDIPRTKEAKEALAKELEERGRIKELVAYETEVARKKTIAAITGYRNRQGKQDLAEGVRRYVEGLESDHKAVLGRWLSGMDEMLEAFKKGAFTGDRRRQGDWVGNKDARLQLDNWVLEILGKDTGDKMAKDFAKMAADAFEKSRLEFNAKGGNIGKLESYFPQYHNPEALLRYKKEPWIEYMMGKDVLDRTKTVHSESRKPLSDDELREALGVIWDRITTDGWIDFEPAMATKGKGGALYTQHNDPRFLHFKPDAWLEYSKQFGSGDAYKAFINHMERMARDVAAMERLGPNPRLMLDYASDFARQKVVSSRTVEANRQDKMAELRRLQAKRQEIMERQTKPMSAAAIQRIEALHINLENVLRDLDEIRNKGRGRSPAELERAGLLHQDLARIETELAAARNDPFDGLKEPLSVKDTKELMETNDAYWRLLDETKIEATSIDDAMRARVNRVLGTTEQIWLQYTGATNVPHDLRLANAATTIRNFNVFTKLGGASITALTDLNTQRLARMFVGMDKKSGFKDIVAGAVQNMTQDGRAQAIRSWVTVDSALNTLNQQARFAGSLNTAMWSGYIADRVMAASGLSAMTQAQKLSYAMDFFGMMADHVGKAYKELPDEVRRMFVRNQFGASDWEKMGAAKINRPHPDSAGWLRPPDVEAVAGREIALRYASMMYSERQFAIIEPNLRSRAVMNWGTQRGTWVGELTRSAMQFKSFGATILMLHGGRLLDEIAAERWKNVAAYAVGIGIVGTLLGAVVIQTKDVVYGRDPRPMDNLAFWGQAILQAGGFGIYGDFIQASGNRFGGGLASTLAGPTAGEIEKFMNLTVGNLKELAQGKETNAGSELARFLSGAVPTTFYTRKATEAFLFDNVARALDPDADEGFRRRIKTRAKDYNGQSFWWEPGEQLPSRGPDTSRVVGSQ
jgi:hypothetical protein